jgi:hypothetical protein
MDDYVFKLLNDDGAILSIHSTVHRELRLWAPGYFLGFPKA